MSDVFPLAVSTLGCPDWTLEQAAEVAAENGYRALEIRLLDGEIIPPDLSAEGRQRIRQVMRRHGLEIVGLGASTRFSAPDREQRQENVRQLCQYLELANDLGASMVRTFGGNVHEGYTMEQTISWVAESLAKAAPTAEKQGVYIGLETHDAFCLGADVARVLEKVPSPWIVTIWDVHHPFRMGESIEETWQHIGGRLRHVHMKDARRRPDGSWQLVLLGEGEVPCRDVVNLLRREGYAGTICAEWEKKWHPEIEEPEVAFPQHARVLREWLS
jgi:sugar phosphate isomerase/epimerase